jgi:adhesin transport system outer membrane protein
MVNHAVVIKRVFISFMFAGSVAVYGVDLKSALGSMVENHPDILQKRQELSSANHELQIAHSGFLPKINLRSSIAQERANTQMTGFANRDFNTLNTNITLTQNLFSGFATDSEIAQKKHNIQMKSYELEEKINDLSLRLIKSYLDVLKADELLEVEQENAKAHEKMYQKITLKTQSGSGRIADHKEMLSKLALSYVNTLTQDNNYNDAAAILRSVMGYYPKSNTLVKPSIATLALPSTLEEALDKAIQKNPTLLISRSQIESSKNAVSMERSNYYPKVDAEMNARAYDNANGTGNIDKTAAAMVTLSYNLYNGGSDEARVMRSLSEASNAIEHRRSFERDVIEKMAKAYNAYAVFERQKPFLEVYRDASFEKTHFYQEEFDLGRRSLIDLLESEDEYNTARRKAIENEYELLYSFFRVLSASNDLIPYFQLDVQSHQQPKNSLLYPEKEPINSMNAPSLGEYPLIATIPFTAKGSENVQIDTPVAVSSTIESNPQKGYENYLKAARLGDKEAQKIVAVLYEKGVGTPLDKAKAAYWKNRTLLKELSTAHLQRAKVYRALGERDLPLSTISRTDNVKREPSVAPSEKAKSLDERLQELGIILNRKK